MLIKASESARKLAGCLLKPNKAEQTVARQENSEAEGGVIAFREAPELPWPVALSR